MFCPECEAEYKEGIVECADCSTALVPKLIEPDHNLDEPIVSVFRSADASLLPVLKSVLDAADIPFFIQGDESSGLFPFGSDSIMPDSRRLGAVIRVPESRAEEARALIESAAPPEGYSSKDDD